jgi:CubicO group peptidase (beta-lactamase class C family)
MPENGPPREESQGGGASHPAVEGGEALSEVQGGPARLKVDSGPLQSLLEEGVARPVFPSAQAVILQNGQVLFDGVAGDAQQRTLFDLASLTKVICTTAAFVSLWAEGVVDPDAGLEIEFPKSAVGRAGTTYADLLYHRAGLPAFVPFFAPVMRAFPALFDPGCPATIRVHARNLVVQEAFRIRAPAAASVLRSASLPRSPLYSDVGFIILGEALAKLARLPLDQLYQQKVASKLGLISHFRRLSQKDTDAIRQAVELAVPRQTAPPEIAPTGTTRPREPAPGQEKMWEPIEPHPTEPGEVDDDNAWAMDGVAGHAGLFGTAADVAKFGQAILDEFEGAAKLAPKSLWEHALAPDAQTPGSTRALGFDTPWPPELGESSAGKYIGRVLPGAVGHLGFTGCSLWIDLGRRLVVALCTNRALLGRKNDSIRQFRPRFHDAVVEAVGLHTQT